MYALKELVCENQVIFINNNNELVSTNQQNNVKKP